jgi:hypothetical protein
MPREVSMADNEIDVKVYQEIVEMMAEQRAHFDPESRKMYLDRILLKYQKGYFYVLKTDYSILGGFGKIPGYLLDMLEDFIRFFKSFLILIAKTFAMATVPVWFIPFTFLCYKVSWHKIKNCYKIIGVDLTKDYMPERNEEDV